MMIYALLIPLFLTCSIVQVYATTFYIVRHGQTDWNVEKRIQGHTDIPLNPEGKLEVLEASSKLQTIVFDACYSSHLQRAVETLTLICPDKPRDVDHRLIERYYGKWEGRLTEEFGIASFEEIQDVETNDSVIERAFQFLHEKALDRPNENLLIVTHSGVVRCIVAHFTDPATLGQIRVKNAGIITLSYLEGKWSIIDLDGVLGVDRFVAE